MRRLAKRPIPEVALGGLAAGVATTLAAHGHQAFGAVAVGLAVGLGGLLGEHRAKSERLAYVYDCDEHGYHVESSTERIVNVLRSAHERSAHASTPGGAP